MICLEFFTSLLGLSFLFFCFINCLLLLKLMDGKTTATIISIFDKLLYMGVSPLSLLFFSFISNLFFFIILSLLFSSFINNLTRRPV